MSQEVALESAVESAFESQFAGELAPPPKVGVPEPAAAPEATEAAPEQEAAPEGEQAPEQQAAPEPEFEFEYEGKTHKLIGNETIRAELAKARDYSQKTEQIARVREVLAANLQVMQQNEKFQVAIFGDLAELRALDSRLEAYGRVDWNAAIDSNFTEAMKLQEQRNAVKQARDAKLAEITQKQQQFQQGQAQAAQQLLAAEGQALVAKLPEWRNSEKASTEQKQITDALANYGFNQVEIGNLMDHRMVLVARDAMLYRQLVANKDARVKQARQAPPMVAPGAQPAKPDGRVQFAKDRAKIRELGTKGNHAAQERMVTSMFERAFQLDKPR